MNTTLSAAVANQRHAELVARAEAQRQANAVRQARRSHRASSRQGQAIRLRRRPFAALSCWFAAGQL